MPPVVVLVEPRADLRRGGGPDAVDHETRTAAGITGVPPVVTAQRPRDLLAVALGQVVGGAVGVALLELRPLAVLGRRPGLDRPVRGELVRAVRVGDLPLEPDGVTGQERLATAPLAHHARGLGGQVGGRARLGVVLRDDAGGTTVVLAPPVGVAVVLVGRLDEVRRPAGRVVVPAQVPADALVARAPRVGGLGVGSAHERARRLVVPAQVGVERGVGDPQLVLGVGAARAVEDGRVQRDADDPLVAQEARVELPERPRGTDVVRAGAPRQPRTAPHLGVGVDVTAAPPVLAVRLPGEHLRPPRDVGRAPVGVDRDRVHRLRIGQHLLIGHQGQRPVPHLQSDGSGPLTTRVPHPRGRRVVQDVPTAVGRPQRPVLRGHLHPIGPQPHPDLRERRVLRRLGGLDHQVVGNPVTLGRQLQVHPRQHLAIRRRRPAQHRGRQSARPGQRDRPVLQQRTRTTTGQGRTRHDDLGTHRPIRVQSKSRIHRHPRRPPLHLHRPRTQLRHHRAVRLRRHLPRRRPQRRHHHRLVLPPRRSHRHRLISRLPNPRPPTSLDPRPPRAHHHNPEPNPQHHHDQRRQPSSPRHRPSSTPFKTTTGRSGPGQPCTNLTQPCHVPGGR